MSGNVLSGTPGSGDLGQHSITVSVNDGTATVDQSFELVVFDDAISGGGGPTTTNAVTLIAKAATWKYLDDGSNQGAGWTAIAFNDDAWAAGGAPLGYGNVVTTTVGYGPDDQNKYVTTYFRHSFNVSGASDYTALDLSVMHLIH